MSPDALYGNEQPWTFAFQINPLLCLMTYSAGIPKKQIMLRYAQWTMTEKGSILLFLN
jgi:hypothetical protein